VTRQANVEYLVSVSYQPVLNFSKLSVADRSFWAWLSGALAYWRSALVLVKPETVIAWHRKG
jgi:hypothetical protein